MGILVECPYPCANRIASGVVAADYQEDEVAQKFMGFHIFSVVAMGEHGHEVIAWFVPSRALAPKLGEVGETFHQFFFSLFHSVDDHGPRREAVDI